MNNTVKNILLGKSYFLLVCIMLLLNACTNTNNQDKRVMPLGFLQIKC